MAAAWYNKGKEQMANGGFDFLTSTMVALLVDDGHTLSVDDDFISTISADELAGTGYSRQTLASKAVNLNDTDDRAELDCGDVAYGALDADNGTVRAMVVAYNSGADATSPLLFYIDFTEGDIPMNGATFTVNIDSVGLGYF